MNRLTQRPHSRFPLLSTSKAPTPRLSRNCHLLLELEPATLRGTKHKGHSPIRGRVIRTVHVYSDQNAHEPKMKARYIVGYSKNGHAPLPESKVLWSI